MGIAKEMLRNEAVFAIAVVLSVSVAFGASLSSNAGQKSQMYLYQGGQQDGGAWAKILYSANTFMLNGHKLQPSTAYTLISFNEFLDGMPLSPICIAYGSTGNDGEIHMTGQSSLAAYTWLVLGNDIDCGFNSMTTWNPGQYLTS